MCSTHVGMLERLRPLKAQPHPLFFYAEHGGKAVCC
jgi:hypothetical protein